ncbi:MAG: hypothetical protein LBQ40_03395 [Clostridiales bacterium]|jgi:hypothetical protein|nr:hypothetical protein [Clostridiales bacterium]
MKLWIKIMNDDKVFKGIVRDVRDGYDELVEDMRTVCGELDIPTPMILRSRYEQLINFNMLKLTPSDFIESVGFDCLFIENWITV